jgi:hypothetical protein
MTPGPRRRHAEVREGCAFAAVTRRKEARSRGVIDTSESPYVKLRSLDLGAVTWNGGFWWALRPRIPGWAGHATLTVNGKPAAVPLTPSSYAEIRRTWPAGDVIDVEFPLQPVLIEANPLVEETANQVAVMRGPIVYCLESVDLPDGVRVLNVAFLPHTRFRARYDAALPPPSPSN